MRTYLIHQRKAGAQVDTILDRVPIFADNDDEAAEKFTDWVMDWMSQDNSESAIQETEELRDYVEAHGNLDSYSFDGVRYWFQEEEDTFTCDICGKTAPISQMSRVLLDPEDGHSDSVEFCNECHAKMLSPLNAAIAAISQDENINQAFRDGLRGLSL